MTEEKRNRLIAAVTVNVILLIAILAAVCVYQLAQIVIIKNRKNTISKQIDDLTYKTEINEKTLDYYKSEEGLLDLAYEYGFVFNK